MTSIIDDFEKMYSQVTSEQFLSMQALGGEIPFFIYSFDAVSQDLITSEANRLIKRVEQDGLSILTINLFDLMVEILEERGMLDKVLSREKTLSRDKFFSTVKNMLDVQTKIMPKIDLLAKENKTSMVFITGVGEVFPYIRSHQIINNLQNVILDRPTLMFFPGKFDGHRLSLFGKIHDDNHYRAFNISNYKF